MSYDIDLLEEQLLALGSAELALEREIVNLQQLARKLSDEGKFEEGDTAWALRDEAKAQLKVLRQRIDQVESRLYGLRRRAATGAS